MMKTAEQIFGLNLRNARKKINMRQEDLAKAVNKDRNTIGSYERGASFPPLNILIGMATALNVNSLDDLIGYKKSESNKRVVEMNAEEMEELVRRASKDIDPESARGRMLVLIESLDDSTVSKLLDLAYDYIGPTRTVKSKASNDSL